MNKFFESISLKPVNVNGGNKFRGFAYIVDTKWRDLPRWYEGCSYEIAILWSPETGKKEEATLRYCEPAEVPAERLERDLMGYARFMATDLLEWCKTKKDTEQEAIKFARAILAKRYEDAPLDELLPLKEAEAAHASAPAQSSTYDRIVDTLKWTATLKSQTCCIAGRWVGGNALKPAKRVEYARKALHTKGVDQAPDFNEAWARAVKDMLLTPRL